MRDFTPLAAAGAGYAAGLAGLAARRGRRRLRRRLFGPELDVGAILVDELLRDAFDHGELIDGLERTVFVAVAHDGLGLRRADAVQRLGERRGIGGVDVDGLGVNEGREQHHGRERGDEMFE